jgi:hypothetical protein
MKAWIAVLSLLSASVWAQPAIVPPQLGFVADSAHVLRPVYGLAGNFILGPSIIEKVLTVAFSGSLGLLKTDSSLAAFDPQGTLLGSVDAPPGPALFSFSPNGATALAYLASSDTLIEWRGGEFVSLDLQLEIAPEAILAIVLPNSSEASLIVEKAGEILEVRLPLNHSRSHSQRALAGVTAPLLALPSGDLVYSDSNGIVLRRPNESEVHITAELPSRFSLQQMDRDWVQLTDLNSFARFAIHTATGREAFFQLPE